MTLDTIRAKIIASLWQGIAQSGIELSSLPMPEQEKLVSRLADQMMLTFDSLLEEASGSQADEKLDQDKDQDQEKDTDEFEEKILWQGRPFLSLVEHYTLTNERLKVVHGLMSRKIENYELIRVQDIDFKQNISERALHIGDIEIHGQDPSNPTIILRNVPRPEEVYELLRRAWLESRKRHGLQFQEFM